MNLLEELEAVSLADICPKRGCGRKMVVAIREHAIERRCVCGGYSCLDVSGLSKLLWHEAGLSNIRIDARSR